MSRNFLLFTLTISVVFLNVFANYQDDEYYCKNEKEYKICHRCSDLETENDLDATENEKWCPRKSEETDCRCDNIAINDSKLGKFIGGPECEETEDEYGEDVSFCYVSEDSNCEDMEESDFASRNVETSNIWFRGKIYKSAKACLSLDTSFQRLPGTGSEEFLKGVQITKNNLINNVTNETSTFDFKKPAYKDWIDSDKFKVNYTKWLNETDRTQQTGIHLHCAYQCAARNNEVSLCGAWSYDTEEKICYIHYVEACCAQLDKQVKNKSFVSGYICPHCSSTRNKCPCTKDDLEKSAINTGHSRGGAGGGGRTSAGYQKK